MWLNQGKVQVLEMPQVIQRAIMNRLQHKLEIVAVYKVGLVLNLGLVLNFGYGAEDTKYLQLRKIPRSSNSYSNDKKLV